MTYLRCCHFFVFLCFMHTVSGQMPQLQRAINTLKADAAMQSANWSVCVRDANSGKILIAQEAAKCLVTASSMKAITSATALELLGPDYRFETRLAHSGSIDEAGVLQGNIYLIGGGDPTLGSNRFGKTTELTALFQTWAEQVKALGIKEIQGKVIGDASHFSSQLTPGNWNWEDMGNYYGAGASGLNVYENLYTLYMKPGSSKGKPVTIVRTYPEIDGLLFKNELSTGAPGSGDNAYIYGSPYTYQRYVRGTIPAGVSSFKIKGSIPEPDLLCAQLFAEALENCGISISEAAEANRAKLNVASLNTFYTHQSPTLREILSPLNQKSINLYAEALLKAIGKEKGKAGSTAEGLAVLNTFWENKGISMKWQYLRDGSGLSANNAVSTACMTHILSKSWQGGQGNILKKSLPLAGRSGSLKGMLKGTVAEGKLYAKSGYISGVRAYTGYVTTSDGRELCFAMLANNYACGAGSMRRKFEKIMAAIAAGK